MTTKKTYDQIISEIREVTDPEQSVVNKMYLWMNGGAVLPQIAALREAAVNLRRAVGEPSPHNTPKSLIEEMEDTLRKLDKNVQRVIADYGRYADHVQSCSCEFCMADNASNN